MRSRVGARGNAPWRLTRPWLGMRPVIPHAAAGARIDPPVSDASAIGQSLAATATAGPLDEAPGQSGIPRISWNDSIRMILLKNSSRSFYSQVSNAPTSPHATLFYLAALRCINLTRKLA